MTIGGGRTASRIKGGMFSGVNIIPKLMLEVEISSKVTAKAAILEGV